MTDSEQLILQNISDMRSDMHNGFNKLYDIHVEHTKSDNERFEKIGIELKEVAVNTATAKGLADGKAKVWATVTASLGAVGGVGLSWLLKKIGL